MYNFMALQFAHRSINAAMRQSSVMEALKLSGNQIVRAGSESGLTSRPGTALSLQLEHNQRHLAEEVIETG